MYAQIESMFFLIIYTSFVKFCAIPCCGKNGMTGLFEQVSPKVDKQVNVKFREIRVTFATKY